MEGTNDQQSVIGECNDHLDCERSDLPGVLVG